MEAWAVQTDWRLAGQSFHARGEGTHRRTSYSSRGQPPFHSTTLSSRSRCTFPIVRYTTPVSHLRCSLLAWPPPSSSERASLVLRKHKTTRAQSGYEPSLSSRSSKPVNPHKSCFLVFILFIFVISPFKAWCRRSILPLTNNCPLTLTTKNQKIPLLVAGRL